MSTFDARPGQWWARWALLALFVLLLVPAFVAPLWLFFTPAHLSYRVEAERVVVDATLGGVSMGGGEYPRAELTGARRATVEKGAWRVAGTAMGGFCAGRWRLADGRYAQLATTCENPVVELEFAHALVVIAPTDADGMLAALATPGQTWTEERALPRAGQGGERVLTVALAGVVLATMGVLARVAWRPMRYRIDGGTLVVPAHFAPVRVTLAGATARRTRLARAIRLGGTAMPGALYLGFFRGCGRWVHCAATTLEEGWLVVGDRAVYVSPADDAAFAAALRDAGAAVEAW